MLRSRRLNDGDCAWCGIEPRYKDQVLGELCREKNNSRRRVRLGETMKPHKPGAETTDSRDWFAQDEVKA